MNETENMSKLAKHVIEEVKRIIIGKDEILEKIMMALLVGGHVLIEDIPGVGKTTMATAFSQALGFSCNRVQFTPDIMPSDIMGFTVYNQQLNTFEYRKGAAMCNILLADEINRTSPKTQSALLQVMEESKVSVDGKTYNLPDPFMVIATQNPEGSLGTQNLPESQLDRFMIRISMGYPEIKDEISILKNSRTKRQNYIICNQIVNIQEFNAMRQCVENVYVDDAIYEYIARIAKATRRCPDIELGISPRGSLSILAMAKSEAFLKGNDYVKPSDILQILNETIVHRIVLKRNLNKNRISEQEIIKEIVREIEMPAILKY